MQTLVRLTIIYIGGRYMATYDEMREKGFRDVYGIGDRDTLRRYCMNNRLLLTEIVDKDTLLYEKTERIPVVVGIELTAYEMFRIGIKNEIILIDGEVNPLIKEISEGERPYQSDKAKRNREKKQKRGGYVGGFIPYGYYSNNKKLYVDDYESFIVKFVFYRRSQNCSLEMIAKELNLRHFKNRNGNDFKSGSIESILNNKRFYQGYASFNGEEVKGEHRAILEEGESVLSKEFINKVFDTAIEAKINEHRKKYHGDLSVPQEIHPWIVVDDRDEAKKKIRRLRRES